MTYEKIVTSDISVMGYVEILEASRLLAEYAEHDRMLNGDVQLFFNTHSGIVFLEDSDCNAVCLNDNGKLINVDEYEWTYEGCHDDVDSFIHHGIYRNSNV